MNQVFTPSLSDYIHLIFYYLFDTIIANRQCKYKRGYVITIYHIDTLLWKKIA